jgi:hypothetical protein
MNVILIYWCRPQVFEFRRLKSSKGCRNALVVGGGVGIPCLRYTSTWIHHSRASPPFCFFLSLRSKYSPYHFDLKYSQSTFLLESRQFSRPYKRICKIIVFYILMAFEIEFSSSAPNSRIVNYVEQQFACYSFPCFRDYWVRQEPMVVSSVLDVWNDETILRLRP